MQKAISINNEEAVKKILILLNFDLQDASIYDEMAQIDQTYFC